MTDLFRVRKKRKKKQWVQIKDKRINGQTKRRRKKKEKTIKKNMNKRIYYSPS